MTAELVARMSRHVVKPDDDGFFKLTLPTGTLFRSAHVEWENDSRTFALWLMEKGEPEVETAFFLCQGEVHLPDAVEEKGAPLATFFDPLDSKTAFHLFVLYDESDNDWVLSLAWFNQITPSSTKPKAVEDSTVRREPD